MILLIDHYDSFTYNIYQAIAAMNVEIEVVRYGVLTLDEIKAKNPKAIILSPGPGHPLELPQSIKMIQELHQSIPILGICLGQQLIGAAFGGKVVQAPFIRHGKVSEVSHNQQGLFKNMPLPLPVMRYHSLVLEPETLAACLQIQSIALDDDTIMAVKHQDYPVYGIQFHPESIGTPDGVELMKEFVVSIYQETGSHL